MDFFYGQDSLTAFQWIMRAIISFVFLLLTAKVMGQRTISQLRLLDFIIALIIGNIFAHPLSDERLGMKGSMITLTVLVILYLICVFSSLKWVKVGKFFEPPPLPIIENGRIFYKNLVKARISIDSLLSASRKEQIADINKVALALWEPDGEISFFLNSPSQPVTPADMVITTKPFTLPKVIVKEGKVDLDELHKLGKDVEWLKRKAIEVQQVELNQILLATIDGNDHVNIFLYK